jgi:uncharacterized membrane protein
VPREQIRPLDMRLEDAMRFVVTAGVRVEEPQIQPVSSLAAQERWM